MGSDSGEHNIPSLSWAREVYDLLPRKYKKHMKHMHVVHPSFMFKMATWFLQTFVSPKFWNKFITHDDLETLFEHVPEADAQLPGWVDAFNRAIFNRYYIYIYATSHHLHSILNKRFGIMHRPPKPAAAKVKAKKKRAPVAADAADFDGL